MHIQSQVKLNTMYFTFEGDSSHKKFLSYIRMIVQQFLGMNYKSEP